MAKSFSLSTVLDQATDGDFCNSIYSCNLSNEEILLLNTQDNQGYQIKDHTGIYPNGAWPQIYFAPDRYLEFKFENPKLSAEDVILDASVTITHKINAPLGSKQINYDVKLEISANNGSSWEILSTNLWPDTPDNYTAYIFSLPQSFLNLTSLNNFKLKLSVFGDNGQANLSSTIDFVNLNINYYNSTTNTPPVNTINSPNENQQLKNQFTFNVSVADDFGISEYQLNLLDKDENLINDCVHETISPVDTTTISCQINTGLYTNGEYKLQVKTKDNADKWTSSLRPIIFDNTPPTTTPSSILPQNDTFWKNTITISGTSQDNSQISLVDLYFKESDTTNPWSQLTTLVNSVTGSVFSWSYSWNPLDQKSYNLASSAKDEAGNQEEIQTISQKVIFDQTKPSTVKTIDSGLWSNSKNLTFSWPPSQDTLSGIDHYLFYLSTAIKEKSAIISALNIGNVNEYTLSDDQSSSLSDGVSYHAKVKAVDKAGNIANTYASSWSNGITIDSTAPEANWQQPLKDNLTVSDSTTLTIIATDGQSGIESVAFFYKQDTDANYQEIKTLQSTPYTANWETLPLPLGDYKLKATITDTVGNQKEIFRDIAVSSIISQQIGTTPAFGQITVGWTTNKPTSGRLVYDTISHPVPNPNHINYSYAFSSGVVDLAPKTTSHLITLKDLQDNTVYYYRIISSGSPVTVGQELSNKTFSQAGPGENNSVNNSSASIQNANVLSSFTTVFPNSTPTNQTIITQENQTVGNNPVISQQPETQVLGAATNKPKIWPLIFVVVSLIFLAIYLLTRKQNLWHN